MKHYAFLLTVIAVLVGVPFLFQNCSQGLPAKLSASSVADTLPFAFDAKVDHIAYMSCSGMPNGFDTSAFFMYKAGAYGAGSGIKFNSDFIYAVRNLTDAEKVNALGMSPINHNAVLQLGMRSSANLQYTYLSHGTFLAPLINSGIALPMATNNGSSYINTFGAYSGQPFEANLQLYSSSNTEAGADSLRTYVSGSEGFLTVNYSRSTNENEALSDPLLSTTSIFGLGYRPTFILGRNQTSGSTRVLGSLTEYDLKNQQLTGTRWNCSQEYSFMIVDYNDATGVSPRAICNTSVEPTPANATQQDAYNVIRKILPANKWYVDLNNHCVVPKAASLGACYGTSGATINYNGGVCFPNQGTCPHYISVCVRN